MAPDTEQDIKFLTVELDDLPSDATAKFIRNKYFKEAHIVKTEQQIDNITGSCTGKAKVLVRCENNRKSNQVLKQLEKNGATFSIDSIVESLDH